MRIATGLTVSVAPSLGQTVEPDGAAHRLVKAGDQRSEAPVRHREQVALWVRWVYPGAPLTPEAGI